MRILIVAIFSTLLFIHCQNECKVLPNGYAYKIHKTEGRAFPIGGDIVTLDFEIFSPDREILESTRDFEQKPVIQIPRNPTKETKANPLISLVSIMGKGDSASIFVPYDSLSSPTPEMEGMTEVEYVVKVIAIEDNATYKNRVEYDRLEKANAIKAMEPEKINVSKETFNKYLSGQYSDRIEETEHGIKYVILNESDGPVVDPGNYISVHYVGFLKNGNMFDNSYRAGKEFYFRTGVGSVIKGWEIGIPMIPEGGKALLDIPYALAYGAAGNGRGIGEKEDLIFIVEVLKVYN